MKIVCRCIVFLFGVSSALAGGIERLHQFIGETQCLRADFVQTVTPKAGRTPQQSSGQMAFSRPGKFRWQIEKPFAQLMVGDGRKVWMFDPDLKQVTIRKMDQALGSTPAALLAGNAALEKAFVLKERGVQDGFEWVEATPKNSDSGFESMRLGFAGAELRFLEMRDNFGQVTRITFLRIERNPALPPEFFRFALPAGVDVLGE